MNTKEQGIITFKRDENNLLPLAEEKESVGDNEGAISLYLALLENNKPSPKIYKKIANLYTSLEMYSNSAVYWYKYLNCVTKRHFAEAYNGLGGNYYLLGENDLSAYYFNLQINDSADDELPFDDYLYDLFYTVTEKNPPFKIVDDQGEEDKDKIRRAKELFEDSAEEAYRLLQEIKEDSSEYENACITLGAFYMIDGEYLKAIERYQLINENSESYEYALNNIFGAYFCLSDIGRAEETLAELKKKEICDFDQLVKFFHLIRSIGNHGLNYKFSRYLRDLFSTPRIYFYCGVAAYNVEKYDEAKDFFVDYYKVTHSKVAQYNATAAGEMLMGNKSFPQLLPYNLIFPESKIIELEGLAPKYLVMSKRQLRKKASEIYDFAEECFCTSSTELQIIACQIVSFLETAQAEKFLKEKLIDLRLSDNIKSIIVTALVEMGNDKLTGLVYGNVYSRLPFERVEFTENCPEIFLGAYAIAFGRMAPYDENELYKLKDSVYDIYYKLVSNGNLKKVNDVLALAAFITINAGIKIKLMPEELITYIGSSVENVNKIIKLVISE